MYIEMIFDVKHWRYGPEKSEFMCYQFKDPNTHNYCTFNPIYCAKTTFSIKWNREMKKKIESES